MRSHFPRSAILHTAAGFAGVAAITLVCRVWLYQSTNTTTVALAFLLLVLFVASYSRFWVAVATSFAAMAAFNFFFLPPIGTLTVVDPQNWVALVAFLAVSLVASQLSAISRERAAIGIERARLELKSTLLSSFAHDLRTPLTAIRVATSNLNATWLDESQRMEQAAIVMTEVDRLSRLFQNILEMTQIDAGAVAVERQWVHPQEIVEAAQSKVQQVLRDHRLDVLGPGDETVCVDPRLTSAALAHVLENAAQYSPRQSVITVEHRLTPQGLLITVGDEGPGVPADDVPHLFERFYSGGAIRRESGRGMGLCITAGLLAAVNGRVWVENLSKGGARFSLLIPSAGRMEAAPAEP